VSKTNVKAVKDNIMKKEDKNFVFFPEFEMMTSPKILISDVKEGIMKGDFSNVRIFNGDETTTFGETINKLEKLVGEENTKKIMNHYELPNGNS
jgi:hypothetical protein